MEEFILYLIGLGPFKIFVIVCVLWFFYFLFFPEKLKIRIEQFFYKNRVNFFLFNLFSGLFLLVMLLILTLIDYFK